MRTPKAIIVGQKHGDRLLSMALMFAPPIYGF